jgi:hypothetical protein
MARERENVHRSARLRLASHASIQGKDAQPGPRRRIVGAKGGLRPKGPGGVRRCLQGLKAVTDIHKGSLSVSRPVTIQGALTRLFTRADKFAHFDTEKFGTLFS